MNRALGVTKQAWSTYAKEMLAIVVAIQTWRPYLLGHKFIIQTYHQSLKHLLNPCVTTPEQQKRISLDTIMKSPINQEITTKQRMPCPGNTKGPP